MIAKRHIILVFAFFLLSFTSNSYTVNKFYNIEADSPKVSLPDETIDYLIITTDNFKSILEPLAIWKTQKGLVSKIEVMSNVDIKYAGVSQPERIRNCIKDYYENNNTQWVLLAGDHNHVPSKYEYCDDDFPYDGDFVSCDSYYTDIDENGEFDYDAEVYVGRLSANNEDEMISLVQRILNYEKNPPIGSWMSHAIFAGSIIQFDQDWNNDNIVDYGECDGNRVNNYFKNLLPDNWTSIFLAQTEGIKGSDNYSDVQLNYNNLKFAIDDGCSIGIINAHGYRQGMVIDEWIEDYDGDMLFDYTADPFFGGGTPVDFSERTNLIDTSYAHLQPEDDKLGLFYLSSCSTGTFDDSNDCLSEYFLKNAAIGCVAASHVAWGEDQWYERDHGGWFVEGLGFRLWEQLFQYNQPGKALALAKADYVSDRNISSEPNEYPEWGNKTLKQYNLLGDPEVPIWLSIPKQLNISDITPQNSSQTILNLKITADNDPIEGVTVTYTKNENLIWKGQTNENGTIEVPISQIDIYGNVLTASKIGFLPYQTDKLQDEDGSSIAGYDLFGISLIILCFIGISSIHHRNSLAKRKTN